MKNLAVSFVLLASSLAAQSDAVEATLVLAKGEHAINDLVHEFAEFASSQVLLDEVEVAASTDLQLNQAMKVEKGDALSVLSTLLYHKGFALVAIDRSRGIYDAVSMNGSRRHLVRSNPITVPVEQLGDWANSKFPVRTLVPLEHLQAIEVATLLRPFLAGSGATGTSFGALGAGAIAIQGFADEVVAAVEMIRTADKPAKKPRVISDLDRRVAELERKLAKIEKLLEAKQK